jgi:hypothetical protein
MNTKMVDPAIRYVVDMNYLVELRLLGKDFARRERIVKRTVLEYSLASSPLYH